MSLAPGLVRTTSSRLLTRANEPELKSRSESAYRVVKQRKVGAPDTIRTCDLCLRRAGASRKGARRLKNQAYQSERCFDDFATARFLTLAQAIPRSRFTALGNLRSCVIFGIDGSDHQSDGGTERSLASKDLQHGSCLDLRRTRRRNSSRLFDRR